LVLRIENILTMHDDMAVIFDENDEQCEVGLDDKNFTFVFNPTYESMSMMQSYCLLSKIK
jgi:hypothetical protein